MIRPFYALAPMCAALLLLACGDDNAQNTPPVLIINDEEDTPADTTPHTTPHTTPDAPVDMDEVDQPGNVVAQAPEGFVYAHDPVMDNRQTTRVTLPRPNNEEGRLSNGAVNVLNCINEEGAPLSFGGLMVGYLCKEVQTALPGADGHYLQHTPPGQDSDPNDTFAEVQMYYHVNLIHDYYTDVLGVSSLPDPIDALPNVQLYTNEFAAQFLGQPPGWFPFDNAAFFFPDAFAQIGLPPRDSGAIVFGQGASVDFSYDTSVIYHEYTHALIGATRLNGSFPDRYGLNNTPGAINEGLADYFATSLLDDPILGRYGLAAFGPDLVRDLTGDYSCPASLMTEVHEDGKIIGAALWQLRAQLGAPVVDVVVMRAISSATTATGFTEFAAALQAEAEDEGVGAEFAAVLDARGLSDCDRARAWTNWQATRVPISAPGPQEAGSPAFREWAPGHLQFFVEVPEGQAVTLTWSSTSQGGGGFGAPQPANLQLATRKGAPVELNIGPNSVSLIEDARLTVPGTVQGQGQQQTTRQTITLGPSCLATPGERTYLMLVNSGGGTHIVQTSLQLVDADTATNLTTCD